MGRGNTDLDSEEYDTWLARNKREKELRERQATKRALSSNVEGWHFGHGKPFKVNSKKEFKQELEKRGLLMKDEITQVTLANGSKQWKHK